MMVSERKHVRRTTADYGAPALVWHWAQAGCYWSVEGYAICTVSGGEDTRAGYRLHWRGRQLGGRFASLADAQQAAERHHNERV